MKTKIVEVLSEILKQIKDHRSIEEVSKAILEKEKFDEQTLNTALGLVYEKLANKNLLDAKVIDRTKNFRILSDDELETIGIDNYNYLLKLQNLGLLQDVDIETIINQLMDLPEEKITENDINFIVLFSMVDINKEIQPGSRIVLISSDTIN